MEQEAEMNKMQHFMMLVRQCIDDESRQAAMLPKYSMIVLRPMGNKSGEFESSDCALCGNYANTLVASKGQFGLPCSVVVCDSCGFSFLDPRWTKDRYDQFYAKEYDRYYRPEVLSLNDDRYKFNPIKQVVARLDERGLLQHFGAVLDLGSGMGHALSYLRNTYAPDSRYDAIEPSEHCRKHLLREGFGHVSADVYDDWDTRAKNTYGLVIMRHVLEHFHDPLSVLRKVRKVLREDGLLYVAVPDALRPTKPLRSHFFRVVHINYFTRHSLSAMLGLAGLEVMHLVEGDQREQHEVFAICKRGDIKPFIPDQSRARKQLDVYKHAGSMDLYYEFRAGVINIIRGAGLIR
jgi:SAM-dependent methyltransferase